MTKKLYLFRHGETDWNNRTITTYSPEVNDIELNEKGLEQARKNAEFLKDKGIQHIYASPLKRAYKTGEILANLINVGIEVVADLEEHRIDPVFCTGFSKADMEEKFGKEDYYEFFNVRDGCMDKRAFNGETKREARERISKAVDSICRTTPYDIIGIASHGFVLMELLRASNFENDSSIRNCEVIEAEYCNGSLNIIGRICNEN